MTDEPTPADRPVRVILDASAIVAFTRSSIHVGEVLAEVDDEGCATGLPVPCLVEAVHAVADTDRLDLLVTHRATVILPDETSWQALAAIDYDAAVLSTRPGLYAGLDNGGLVITAEE